MPLLEGAPYLLTIDALHTARAVLLSSGGRRRIFNRLSLTLADSGGVSESIFHALPNMVRNFYTVSAWPGHERNLMVPDFAADRCDRVAEGQDRFRIPCGGFGLELSRFIEIVCPECYD